MSPCLGKTRMSGITSYTQCEIHLAVACDPSRIIAGPPMSKSPRQVMIGMPKALGKATTFTWTFLSP